MNQPKLILGAKGKQLRTIWLTFPHKLSDGTFERVDGDVEEIRISFRARLRPLLALKTSVCPMKIERPFAADDYGKWRSLCG